MRAMALFLSLAAAGLFGLAGATPARASDVRVYVDLGDIVFTSGRAHYRHTREPLYVEYHRYGPPRYYRVVEHRYYGPPGPPHFVPPGHYVRHYGPPPKRYKHRDHRRHDPYYRGRGEVVIRYRY